MVLVFSFFEAVSSTPLGDGYYSILYIFFMKIVLQRLVIWKASNLDEELLIVFLKGVIDISSAIITFHLKSYSQIVLIFVILMMWDAFERFLIGSIYKKINSFFLKSSAGEGNIEQVDNLSENSDDDDREEDKPMMNKVSISLIYSMASNLQDVLMMTVLFK